jgi:hypothetical protein
MDHWKIPVAGDIDDGLEDGGYDDDEPMFRAPKSTSPPKRSTAARVADHDDDDDDDDDDEEADEIRAKYGAPKPPRPSAIATRAQPSVKSRAVAAAAKDFDWKGSASSELQRLTEQNASLLDKLASKDVELEKLEQTVLALEPAAGMDPAKIVAIADRTSKGMSANQAARLEGGDPRDAKIVELAKRNRELTSQLGKAKRAVAEAKRKAGVAHARVQELEAIQESPKKVEADVEETGSSEALRTAQGRVRQMRARVEGMQHKLEQAQAVAKAARRALAAELGPGPELEAVLSQVGLVTGGGSDAASVASSVTQTGTTGSGKWRGRAQQIAKLRARVAELEDGHRAGVDSQAKAVIGAMEAQRVQASEEVSFDGSCFCVASRFISLQLAQSLEAEVESHRVTASRLEAAKARMTSMQREVKQLKEAVSTMASKSEVDDKLVEGLRAERVKLQQQLSEERRFGADGGSSPSRTVFSGGVSRAPYTVARGPSSPGTDVGGEDQTRRLMAESERLSRLAQGQSRRIEAQDKVIADLRKQLKAAAAPARPVEPRPTEEARPPSSRSARSAGGDGSAATARELAALQLRVEAADKAAKVAQEDASFAKEANSRSEERCRMLERQIEQYVSRFSALERRCRELEAVATSKAPATDAVSLAAQLATSENERKALRSNSSSAIAARDAEIARLRERCDSLVKELDALLEARTAPADAPIPPASRLPVSRNASRGDVA